MEQRSNDFLRPLEDAALLTCASPAPERIVVWLLRWTGLRISEACALQLQDVNLTAQREALLVRKSRTTAGVRTIPLVPCLIPELETWLLSLAERGLTGSAFKPTFVWANIGTCAGTLHQTARAACAAATHSDTVSGENVSAITPHTLPRTFGSYLLNRGLAA